jgi:valyl-tRNA synthetase
VVAKYPQGIPAMGTDALRFTLITSGSPGNDLNLSLERVEANRNFANKLWNAGRFVIGNFENLPPAGAEPELILADRWILTRLVRTAADVTRLMDTYQYGEAGRMVYEFLWGEFADWYIELSKLQIAEGGTRARATVRILARVLDGCLRMLHPFTPFVTEALWGHLKEACQSAGPDFSPVRGWPEALIIAPWPILSAKADDAAVNDFALFMEIVRAIRNLRAEKKVPLGKKIRAVILAEGHEPLVKANASGLCALARIDLATLAFTKTPPAGAAGMVPLVVGPIRIFIPLADIVDAGAERTRLQKEADDADAQITRVESLLASDFGTKAPAAVIEKERARLAALKETRAKLSDQLKAVGK